MQGIGVGGANTHAPIHIPGTIGMTHALRAALHRRRAIAQGELQLAEVSGSFCCIYPILLFDTHFDIRPHRLQGLTQAPQGVQPRARPVQHNGLSIRGQIRRWGMPGFGK
jgi:hypothetical protein